MIGVSTTKGQYTFKALLLSFLKIIFELKKLGGVLKSMLTLNEAIIDVKEG